MGELEELRELKDDIERREKAQAVIVENQAKRLEQVQCPAKCGPARASPIAQFCSTAEVHVGAVMPAEIYLCQRPTCSWPTDASDPSTLPPRCCSSASVRLQVETLYREEALNRKKIFNAMEDLKVRLLCDDPTLRLTLADMMPRA